MAEHLAGGRGGAVSSSRKHCRPNKKTGIERGCLSANPETGSMHVRKYLIVAIKEQKGGGSLDQFAQGVQEKKLAGSTPFEHPVGSAREVNANVGLCLNLLLFFSRCDRRGPLFGDGGRCPEITNSAADSEWAGTKVDQRSPRFRKRVALLRLSISEMLLNWTSRALRAEGLTVRERFRIKREERIPNHRDPISRWRPGSEQQYLPIFVPRHAGPSRQ